MPEMVHKVHAEVEEKWKQVISKQMIQGTTEVDYFNW